jgi:hypothetical protein
MTLGTVLQLATLVSVLIGILSLVNGMRTIRRQMTLQVIMKYTERYDQIMDTFPQRDSIFGLDMGELPERSSALTVSVLKYLNLCSEEFYLKRRNYFSKNVWEIWETDMNRMLSSPLIRREWGLIKQEVYSHREFLAYVNKVHAEKAAD